MCGTWCMKRHAWQVKADKRKLHFAGSKSGDGGRLAMRMARAAQAMAAAAAPVVQCKGLQRRAGLLAAAAGGVQV